MNYDEDDQREGGDTQSLDEVEAAFAISTNGTVQIEGATPRRPQRSHTTHPSTASTSRAHVGERRHATTIATSSAVPTK